MPTFIIYLEIDVYKRQVLGRDANMTSAHAEGITIINFGMGRDVYKRQGQNFAKAFNVQFVDKNNKLDYVWATSWGVSTRLMGALIMTHSDDNGCLLYTSRCV